MKKTFRLDFRPHCLLQFEWLIMFNVLSVDPPEFADDLLDHPANAHHIVLVTGKTRGRRFAVSHQVLRPSLYFVICTAGSFPPQLKTWFDRNHSSSVCPLWTYCSVRFYVGVLRSDPEPRSAFEFWYSRSSDSTSWVLGGFVSGSWWAASSRTCTSGPRTSASVGIRSRATRLANRSSVSLSVLFSRSSRSFCVLGRLRCWLSVRCSECVRSSSV